MRDTAERCHEKTQLYNAGSYTPCANPTDTEDGFCIGGESAKG